MTASPLISGLMRSGLVLTYLVLISKPVFSVEILVPQDVANIPAAVELAANGDEIVVSPGDWSGPIDFLGKSIILRSSAGPDVTRLVGTAQDSVVKFVSGESSLAILDGFSIHSGGGAVTANGICGGGILILNSTPLIRNCVVEDNSAASGAGIHIEGPTFGVVNLESVTVRNNSADDFGGGIALVNNAELSMVDCVVADNYAVVVTGGIQCEASTLTAIGCTISGNTSNLAVGGVWIFLDSEAQFVDSLIENNTSPISGGGIVISDLARATLEGCLFRGNSGGSAGGGVMIDSGSDQENQVIRGCVFHDNYSMNGGAHLAISFNPVSLTIEKCTFGLTAVGSGSAISVNNGTPDAVSIDSSVVFPGPVSSIDAIPGSTLVQYSCVEGLQGLSVTAIDSIEIDPLFSDPANGDYTLDPASPCINNGNPLLPLDPDGTITDMGALGLAPVPVPNFRRGDVDFSGTANIGDAIQILAYLFGSGAVTPLCDDALDCNDDGALNLADAISLLATLFVSGDPLPMPYLECGPDPTDDGLTCNSDCP